ncbi:hypothetical protein JCM8547_003967 [Rhodosporidiobolus lusitaniae]
MDNVEDTFRTNIIQYIGVTKAALLHLKRGDVILNTTAVTAYKGSAGMMCPFPRCLVDYSASRGSVCMLIRSLATQVMPNGLRVVGVAPGLVYTPLQPGSRSADQMDG